MHEQTSLDAHRFAAKFADFPADARYGVSLDWSSAIEGDVNRIEMGRRTM
ncbi:hypothetical protein ACWDYH_24360 [Nocardia goodfellowii]